VRYYADLHVHSKYSRACSRDCDLMHLAWWARRKGITLVGTGDFTHPAWSEELRDSLVPAEPGLFKLRDELDREVLRTLPPSCHRPVRFMLEVEISTIYKRGDKTRKVHHLCYVPDFDAARAFTKSLAKIGNLASDGRPILGLDSRDLLEITLDSGPASYLVPAHAWTPWFAVLGSKSGFDAVEECYADLAGYIFAVETGLSSDPEMNWRVSSLDRYRLVSNSDAHSPPILGRNATIVDTELDYFAVRGALKTGAGYVGTVDMFPEEGKYHWDGHRKCGVGMEPAETKTLGGLCPECGKPVTVGVLHRVDALADREPGRYPATAGESHKIVPLPEIMGEIMKVGPKSKRVRQAIDELVGTLGPELDILLDLPLDEIAKARRPQLTEAVSRLRAERVLREAGYDGEYGKISLFAQGEEFGEADDGLFDLPAQPMPEPVATVARKPRAAAPGVADTSDSPLATAPPEGTGSPLDALDPDQRAAASIVEGHLMVVAGPGTGKTRTLTHRLAHLVTEHGVPPERCVAITFTRRAAEELAERLDALVPEHAARITVATFHRFGLGILREQHARCELPADFALASEVTRVAVLREILEVDHRAARRALSEVSRIKRIMAARLAASASGELPFDEELDGDVLAVAERYDKALHNRNLVDFDDLIARPVALLSRHPELVEHYRARYGWLCVDEYQDVDELQYRLLRLLTPARGNLCVIGDPDQAIYAFRGADVGYFLRFQHDFPDAQLVRLTRNYRSSKVIVSGAVSAIAPSTLVADRELQPMRERPSDRARIVLHAASDEDGEARFIARTIEELLGGSSFHARDSGLVDSDGVRGGLSFDDIAVLYRTDAQARAVMEVLDREGLPFQKRSHDRLGDHPGVRAVLRHVSRDEGLAQGGTPMLLWRAAQRAIAELENQDTGGDPGGSVDAVRDAVDLLGPLARRHAGDAGAFLADLSLGAEVDTWDPRANRISLLTLHAAKGLEFPVVFIAGCAEGLLPLRWPGSSGDPAERAKEEAEERRLFFVGITRAQSHLYLSYPRARTRGEDTTDLRPSPFLSVLGDDILERREDQPKRNAARGKQLRLL
jgi:DNA helicase-2/ATP-dependent DNA helicase PcrA